jgi:hypothetical protein
MKAFQEEEKNSWQTKNTLIKATVHLIHLVSSKFSKPFLGQASQYLQPTKLIHRLNSLDHSVSQ